MEAVRNPGRQVDHGHRSGREDVGVQDDQLPVYGRIALEYGLRFNETKREWARWAATQLR